MTRRPGSSGKAGFLSPAGKGSPRRGGGLARLLGQGPPWVPNSRQTAFLILQPLPS